MPMLLADEVGTLSLTHPVHPELNAGWGKIKQPNLRIFWHVRSLAVQYWYTGIRWESRSAFYQLVRHCLKQIFGQLGYQIVG